ncbi:SIMPL domain-containing protein [Aquamicrobium sp. LC103]|uniref:SIMPL domain-containing protein n=1 Tax=Aquamicrobium sp. LC103 TaxID=1120658 RepID=UPI00063EC154|nr:SIMPL domain-containing protein [Aquamicrobium sp. LC103]TKT80308.1 SIMPL domain-containing protein [Aquamicrobium sp. LC103]
MHRRYLPLLAAAAFFSPFAAHAQDREPTPRIMVVGEGETAVAPDMAILSLTVMREAETARAAMDDANKAMTDVIAAMKEAGIESRDLQTAGLQINPRYVYPKDNDGEQQPRIVAYQVQNTLTVRVRDVQKVGEVIDRSVTLGVNQGGSVSFVNDDPSAALSEARRLAVADATDRARTLAEAAGVELGRVLEMSEQSRMPPPMPMAQGKAMRMEAAADYVPMEAGENTYRVQVNVTFELKQ